MPCRHQLAITALGRLRARSVESVERRRDRIHRLSAGHSRPGSPTVGRCELRVAPA